MKEGIAVASAVVVVLLSIAGTAKCAYRNGKEDAIERYERSREQIAKCRESGGDDAKCNREFGEWTR
jgi:hypothetical protein